MSEKMDVDQVIENILYLPSKFYSLGNVSMITLLQESGYIQTHEQITQDDIRKALIKHEECIKDWMISSEDKRVGSGWYILAQDNGKYVVGYWSEKESFRLPEFENAENACACYIKKEIEQLRNYCK